MTRSQIRGCTTSLHACRPLVIEQCVRADGAHLCTIDGESHDSAGDRIRLNYPGISNVNSLVDALDKRFAPGMKTDSETER